MKNLIYIMILVFYLHSCKFEPSGSNFAEVSPIADPIDLDLSLSHDGDTIFVTQNKTINFSYYVRESNKELLAGIFYFDGEEITDEMIEYSLINRNYEFSVFTSQFDVGTVHTLNLELAFNSGTGSLGDVVGAEVFAVTRKWHIKIIDELDLTLKSPSINIVDQKLFIEWDKPTQNKFSSLEICKLYGSSNYPTNIKSFYSGDSIPDKFYDDRYFGEPAKYFIRAYDQLGYQLISDTITKASELAFEYEVLNDSTFKFAWNKCNYPESFVSYNLDIDYFDYEIITDINDTNFIFKASFGYQGNVSWLTQTQGSYNYYANNDTTINIQKFLIAGFEFPNYSYITEVGNNKVFLIENNIGKIFNLDSKSVELEYQLNNSYVNASNSSLNGDHFLIFIGGSLYWFNNKEGDVKKLILNNITNGDLSGSSTSDIQEIEVSNNGVVILNNRNNNYFYDLIQNKLLLKTEHTFSNTEFYRFDNKAVFVYMVDEKGINKYEFNNGNLINNGTLLFEVASLYSYKFFLSPNDQYQAYLSTSYGQDKTYFINLSSQLIEKEMSGDLLINANLHDEVYTVSKYWSGEWGFNIYDLESNNQLANYKLSRNTNNYKYHHGYLLSPGQMLKVEL